MYIKRRFLEKNSDEDWGMEWKLILLCLLQLKYSSLAFIKRSMKQKSLNINPNTYGTLVYDIGSMLNEQEN